MWFIKRLISKEDENMIVAAIKKAELNTSGEIRVHIESECKEENPMARAIYLFNVLGMYKTAARNGVLIYVAKKSRKFAIIGDDGINRVIPDNYWNNIRSAMSEDFSKGRYAGGICNAILSTGELLKKEFPHTADDVNEQSDEVSFGK